MEYETHNPFEIDNVVEILLQHMDITEIKNSRLISGTFNKNAVNILSRPSIQYKLKSINFTNEVVNFEEILQNSENDKLFRNLDLSWENEDQNSEKISEIVQILQPLEIKIDFDECRNMDGYFSFLFQIFPHICSNLVKFKLLVQVSDNVLRFDLPEICINDNLYFANLKVLHLSNLPENFVHYFIKNSPNLVDLVIYYIDENFCKNFAALENLRHLEISSNMDLNISTELLGMAPNLKLSSFKIFLMSYNKKTFYGTMEEYSSMIENLEKFLQSQSENLKNFEFRVFSLGTCTDINSIIPKIKMPKFEKLDQLKVKYQIHAIKQLCESPESENVYWPVHKLNLAESFPKLVKFRYKHQRKLEENFHLNSPCETLRDLEIDNLPGGKFEEISKLFPKIRRCKLYENCDLQLEKISIQVWRETLEKFEIQFNNFSKLENFDFEQLVCLQNLSELVIRRVNIIISQQPSNIRFVNNLQKDEIHPDFSPFLKIDKLKKISLIDFKISDGILQELRNKYPKIEYKFESYENYGPGFWAMYTI